jgi:type II restriction enzyme
MAAGNWSSWTDNVWNCIVLMNINVGETFTLAQIYQSKPLLEQIYPDNHHIEAKIRQQLQIIKDFGKLEFVTNNGIYRRIK